jgi:hypothetical protein
VKPTINDHFDTDIAPFIRNWIKPNTEELSQVMEEPDVDSFTNGNDYGYIRPIDFISNHIDSRIDIKSLSISNTPKSKFHDSKKNLHVSSSKMLKPAAS